MIWLAVIFYCRLFSHFFCESHILLKQLVLYMKIKKILPKIWFKGSVYTAYIPEKLSNKFSAYRLSVSQKLGMISS